MSETFYTDEAEIARIIAEKKFFTLLSYCEHEGKHYEVYYCAATDEVFLSEYTPMTDEEADAERKRLGLKNLKPNLNHPFFKENNQ